MTPPPAASAAPRLRRGIGGAGTLPRRVSGPSRVPAGRGPAARPQAQPHPGIGAGLWRRLGLLLDSPVLGRLISGRGWIAIVGTALIGLVFFQVSLLKLNSGIGRAVERSSELERQNSALRASVSRLGSNDRIQATAAKMGMVLPAAGEIRFLTDGGRQLGGGDAIAANTSIASGATATLPTPPPGTAAAATATTAAPAATSAAVTPATATVAPTTPTVTPVTPTVTPTPAPAATTAPAAGVTPALAAPAATQAAATPAGGAVAPGQQGR